MHGWLRERGSLDHSLARLTLGPASVYGWFLQDLGNIVLHNMSPKKDTPEKSDKTVPGHSSSRESLRENC